MTKKDIIEFPCDFPIKIIGQNTLTFIDQIQAIISSHFPECDLDTIKKNPSSNGMYIGLTVIVRPLNQDMLDAFYKEISSHPEVKMVL